MAPRLVPPNCKGQESLTRRHCCHPGDRRRLTREPRGTCPPLESPMSTGPHAFVPAMSPQNALPVGLTCHLSWVPPPGTQGLCTCSSSVCPSSGLQHGGGGRELIHLTPPDLS